MDQPTPIIEQLMWCNQIILMWVIVYQHTFCTVALSNESRYIRTGFTGRSKPTMALGRTYDQTDP